MATANWPIRSKLNWGVDGSGFLWTSPGHPPEVEECMYAFLEKGEN